MEEIKVELWRQTAAPGMAGVGRRNRQATTAAAA
jgi:hypothetical protein